MPSLRHDRLAVEQIFSNLMENATKYLQSGRQGVIMVRGRREGSRAIFEVEDNGRGIAPEDHERIFELFRRSGQQDQQGVVDAIDQAAGHGQRPRRQGVHSRCASSPLIP